MARNDAPLVIDAIVRTFPETRSLVDVGAGTGRFVAQASALGLRTVGLERSRVARTMAKDEANVELRSFDLRLNPRPVNADIAYSFEVAEHIPGYLARRFVRFLSDCAPRIVLTAAPPGQGGTGHVNEQQPDYWEGLFLGLAMQRVPHLEQALCDALPFARLSEHWGKTNLMVFNKAT
jgi:hypothetical protein